MADLETSINTTGFERTAYLAKQWKMYADAQEQFGFDRHRDGIIRAIETELSSHPVRDRITAGYPK